jgi:hypothetical protein
MNLVLPPLFFYVIGAVLVIAGAARTLTLGRRRPERDIQGGDDVDPQSTTAVKAAQARRRHMIFGVVWMLLGLFLILSTAGVLKARSSL